MDVVDALNLDRVQRRLPALILLARCAPACQRRELAGGLQRTGQHHPACRSRPPSPPPAPSRRRTPSPARPPAGGPTGSAAAAAPRAPVGQHHPDRRLVGLKGVRGRGDLMIDAASRGTSPSRSRARQAATTGLGNDSSRCDNVNPPLSMSIDAWTSPERNTLRSNPPLNTRSLPAITTAPAFSPRRGPARR